MSILLLWSNVLAYALQIGLVVGLGALVPTLLRMRTPRARLLFWQVLLVACLALPWVRNWRQEVVAGTTQVSAAHPGTASVSAVPATPPARPTLPLLEIALWLIAAGIVVRLGLLGIGLAKLAAYRRRGQELPPELRIAGTMAGAALMLSEDVAGPVTFGWRNPVVLLPANFPSLEGPMRDAILCHELQHVERQDWLFTIAEELVRAVLWFHPAIWWVLGEIQLAREQAVDKAVIEMTQARGPYVDTLLLMAGASVPEAHTQMDLAPAPMFLRRRHLKKRLMEVMKEVRMSTISNTRWACVMGAAVVMVAAASWLATGAFPLAAAPQVMDDAAGVAVNTNGSQLIHRSPVSYPAEARAKGIEGTVVVQLRLDANGEVSDANVLSGPDELRKGVLQSVLTWHFEKSAASATRTVNIDFVKPAATVPAPPPAVQQFAPRAAVGGRGGSGGFGVAPPPMAGKLDRIVVTGLSDSARSELLSRLPVQEGSEWNGQDFGALTKAVKDYDSHLTVGLARTSANGGQLELRIGLSNTGPGGGTVTFSANNSFSPVGQGSGFGAGVGSGGNTSTASATAPASGVYSVGNGTSAPVVLTKVDPVYTEQARAAKYGGSVMLSVVINTDGKAENIQIVKALGMGLDENAMACVQQWVFRPGMNQGIPVKVRAQIEVNFRLLDKE
jgi:TonB family protein